MIPLARPDYTLRQLHENDVDDFVFHANDQYLAQNCSPRFPHPFTAENGKKFIEECISLPAPYTRFCIAHQNRMIGMMSLVSEMTEQTYFAELGYWVGQTARNQGVASMAITAFSDYIFTQFPKIVRLEAFVFPHNVASQKALEKAGFTQEAVLKSRTQFGGEILDDLLYAKLRIPQNNTP